MDGDLPPRMPPPDAPFIPALKHTTHTCQAQGCQHVVETWRLMCMDHWRMAPAALRRELTSAYKAWRIKATPDSTGNYMAVRAAVIDVVARKQAARAQRQAAGTEPLL